MEVPLIGRAIALCIMVSCASCTDRAPVGKELNVPSPRESVVAVKSAVSDYLKSSQEPMSLEMKDALAVLLHDPASTNLAPWSISHDGRGLYHHGYTIGDEHTWFEIHFRDEAGRLVVKDILEQRETIAGEAH